jgi:hypothetical protein
MVFGLIYGVVFLDSVEISCFHTYVGRPSMLLVGLGATTLGALYYAFNGFPPVPLRRLVLPGPFGPEPCCWQVRSCPALSRFDVTHDFACINGNELYSLPRYNFLSTCEEMLAVAMAARS